MKPDRLYWWLSILLLGSFSKALSQSITAVNSGSGGPADIFDTAHSTVAPLETATDGQASPPAPQTPAKSEDRPYGWHTAIYPALAWVPIFGAGVYSSAASEPAYRRSIGKHEQLFQWRVFRGCTSRKGQVVCRRSIHVGGSLRRSHNPAHQRQPRFCLWGCACRPRGASQPLSGGRIQAVGPGYSCDGRDGQRERFARVLGPSRGSDLPPAAWQEVADSDPWRWRRIWRGF